MATNVEDTRNAEDTHITVTVQGYEADLFQTAGTALLTWQNEAGYLFLLRATDFDDTETLLALADPAPYEGTGAAWEMGWVPEGYAPMYRDEGAGAVQQVWVKDGTLLTWKYVTDPICPFIPDGEPEESTCGASPALLGGGESEESRRKRTPSPWDRDFPGLRTGTRQPRWCGRTRRPTPPSSWKEPWTADLLVTFMEETEPAFSPPREGGRVSHWNRRRRMSPFNPTKSLTGF